VAVVRRRRETTNHAGANPKGKQGSHAEARLQRHHERLAHARQNVGKEVGDAVTLV
jgi:hypothetical protein